MLELNKVHLFDNREGIPQLPEKCANLIISDPPYFECKGEFDFIWKSFDEYLEFMEGQAKLYKRILADNGTLFVYGHAKRIAYVQMIFDKYFSLINNITWKKIDSIMYAKGGSGFRCFLPNNERLLMYSNGMEPEEWDKTGWEKVKLDVANFQSLRDYFRDFQAALGMSKKQIVDKIGQRADHAFRFDSTQWDLPTPETYREILTLNPNHGFKPREYEELREEYEALRRPFTNILRLSDVMEFSQEAHISVKYDHDTVKPESLTRALILTCSRADDLVVVPFAGSGTECAMAVKEGRRFVGFEINEKYVEIAQRRVVEQKKQPHLFKPQETYNRSSYQQASFI